MMKVVDLLLLFSVVGASATSIGRTADLVISNKVISPDGFSRSSVLAGGTFPGPVIRGKQGDRFQLNVIDSLTDNTMRRSTSIHWHGLFQDGTNFEDGVAFVNQCPIAPNSSFLYDFTANQSGTYWYHSHLSTQYCDGLRGVFILDDPNDPYKSMYDVDDESTIITLADWYHQPAPDAASNPEGFLNPQSTLINGRGRWQNSTASPAVPLSVVNVKQGTRYRFRLVSTSCFASFNFSIDNHSFTIIEADGQYTQPLQVDSLQIFAAQRYSLIMKADQAVGNYWIRANPDERGVPGFDGGRNSAILRYSAAPATDPTSQSATSKPLQEVNLHALQQAKPPGQPFPGGADVKLNLAPSFDFTKGLFTINGVPFTNPTVPVLLQILSGTQSAQDLLPSGSVYSLPLNKVIEISIPGIGAEVGGPHPFHLHGHSFWVVRSGDNDQYNFENPVRRDTVSTGLAGGNATIRFVTDNAGPWFLHCHIDWHLELGLAVVLAEDIPGASKLKPPSSWDQLCPIYDKLPSDEQ